MRAKTRGEGQIKLILTLLAICAIFFVAYKFIPVKLAHSKLLDKVVEECKMAGANPRATADIIRDNIWEMAVSLDMGDAPGHPGVFAKQDIKVDRTSNMVKVYLEYDRTVELPGYPYVWHFIIDEKRNIY